MMKLCPFADGSSQGPTGARQPSAKELELARTQGKVFYEAIARAHPN